MATAEPADHEALLRFVERFAMVLTDLGIQRMAARVFAYALADDADRYTAAELATALRVSPAAISGALKTLVNSGLLGREREPGDRLDTYRVYDDNLWHSIVTQRERIAEPLIRIADEGAALLGPDTPGGRRMRETREFYRFFIGRLQQLLDEWEQQKEEILARTR